jgi:hypothetical protein
MKRKWLIALAAAAVLLVNLVLTWLPSSPAELPAITKPAAAGQTVTITRSPEEIFRRAFWRRPTPADRIVRADRREWSDQDQGVQRWQWFIQINPSPDLLRALRDPEIFGLASATTAKSPAHPAHPADPAHPASAPLWFPTAAQLAGCEILQSPSGGLTAYYRAAGNVLFATDSGRGFAPPLTQVVSR